MPLVEYATKGRTAYITLDRPEKLNAINYQMLDELWEAFTRLADDTEVWLGIVTGRGRAFSVGHDLVDMGAGERDRDSNVTVDRLYYMVQHTWKPVIAAINGVCLAQGAGIALAADLRVATESAQIGWPQVKRGITSVSGPAILGHRVPVGTAMEVLLTGEFLTASEALRLGLINRVVSQDELMSAAEELAGKILENAPLAVRAMKEALVRGLDKGMQERLDIGTEVFSRVLDTEDAREGLKAFQEKRAPVWKAR